MKRSALFLGFALFLIFQFCMVANVKYDLVIKDGLVFRGDGSPAVMTDIGIRNGKICDLGQLDHADSVAVIDARGLVVTPGFIDVHTHVDEQIVDFPSANNYILMGVTTVIGGNCGSHPFPLAKTFDQLQKSGLAINFGSLAGHNTIRVAVMGQRTTEPTRDELDQMKRMLDQEMKAGALGFSTGLEYFPGMYTQTREIMALAGVIRPYQGVYATHLRNEDHFINDAVKEAIAIGETHHLTVQISHLKLCRDEVWGKLDLITAPIESARARGVKVFTDQYPYAASVTVSSLAFPNWALEGGQDKLLELLQKPESYQRIKEEIIQKKLTSKVGVNKLQCFIVNSYRDPSYIGKNLEEILVSQSKLSTAENGADLIIEMQKNGGAGFTAFQMSEEDVGELMKLEYNMIASDGAIAPYGTAGTHCRSYGTFPRVIRKYVGEQKTLSLSKAIKKMTSLPARSLGLVNRGMIKPNNAADIVIFDVKKIKDKATYQNPFVFPEGIKYVLVNGVIAAQDGQVTGKYAGQIVYGPGK